MVIDHKLQKAEEAIKKTTQNINPRYRLGYHIMGEGNWINDPNGLVQYKGEYHVFYQHHPYDENWGPMHWGHVKSKDLVNWEYAPIALAPGDEYDRDGCFSGSAVNNDGELTLIYTGHNYINQEEDTFYQTQNIAVSTDGVVFEKVGQNPVIAHPPEDSAHHFRDPKVWKHNNQWYMIVGNSTKDQTGRVILYRSQDLRKWEYVGVLAQSDGTLGYMWECPDFFELQGKHILLISPQGIESKGDDYNNLFQTGYFVGEYDYKKNEYVKGEFLELDHGHDFYAAQTLVDEKGRRIVIGWMDMWESEMPTKQDGWCGALTIPRKLTIGENNTVFMNPVEEMVELRQTKSVELENASISDYHLAKENSSLLEIKAEFDLTDCEAESVGLTIKGVEEEEVVITYHIRDEKLSLDCSKMGKKEDGMRTTELVNDGKLTLRIFLDRSSIELFANDGVKTMTSRIYPKEERLGVMCFANKGEVKVKELIYWKLKDIWK
ncbi:glycoside hydrolase family 32 protein [Priestia endophytica]|uniref:glycoside hydrolase family 32 protein n=1 Tax=Priestia endophytica TaxID=135735 RepID=UPI002E1CE842|nr:glycoside hydrolase family 32 protein [Priestia endophytica]